jgi:hypothetical protein
MHYATDKTDMPIVGVDEFTRGQKHVKRIGSSDVEVTAASLPRTPEVWVLEHSL